MKILGAGYGLHWETRDADMSMPGLLARLFGAREHMARLAGQAISPANADTVRPDGANRERQRKESG